MAQPITPLHTHREIEAFAADLRAETITLSCTEGTADEGGTYQPARPFERVIDGEAFAAIASTVITIQTPHQTEQITVRELLKRLLYPHVL
jgi:hypothetical protein